MKILLVEDDADLRDVTAYSLRRERFAVIEACDGAQALHRWKVDRPDLIVLDLGLPRHDGFDVLQRKPVSSLTPLPTCEANQTLQEVHPKKIESLDFEQVRAVADYLSRNDWPVAPAP